MAFWSFELAEPGHECVDLSKASDWFQVTNTLASMLVELHISGCELNQIPVGVANTTRLKVVNLRWNIIWGTISQWLYSCSNLESLSFYLNLLRGEISSSIGNLTAIVNLDLSANQIEEKMPNSLGNLCQMESLKLSTNDFSGPLSDQLGNFRHFRLLALSKYSRSDIVTPRTGSAVAGYCPLWAWLHSHQLARFCFWELTKQLPKVVTHPGIAPASNSLNFGVLTTPKPVSSQKASRYVDARCAI
ncbi:hypothetical protein L3X38_016170 [Prunus dulcis]|uniref:Uncharacterized protein n=1 Tax=Prunus dulcis TaxID=3755 RepID=A0AAD4W7B6_PRUDU|nr:hypothetical protein L3X38_016170 [Prunus dulcis]